MAYSKPFVVVQDFAVGVQSVNRLVDNNDAAHALWIAKHGQQDDPQPLSLGEVANSFGHHNDILIARSVSHMVVTTAADGTKYLVDETVGEMVRSTQRIGVGQWRIYLNSPDIYGAIATPVASSAQDYKMGCRAVAGTGTPPIGVNGYIDVSAWNVPTATRVDIDFSLVIWGRAT